MIKRNVFWWYLVLISYCLVIFTYLEFSSTKAIQLSSYLGLGYLSLTLIPTNFLLLRIKLPGLFNLILKLSAKHRRDFGITTAFLFGIHAIFAYLVFAFGKIDFLVSKPIILGLVAGLILIVLLITSTAFALKKLGKNWKRIHRLVWVAVGLLIIHSYLASSYYSQSWDKIALSFAILISIYLLFEYFTNVMKDKIVSYRIIFVVIGLIISGLVIFGLSVLTRNTSPSNNAANLIVTPTQIPTVTPTQTPTVTPTPTTSLKTISSVELAKHNNTSSCYISFQGTVYDITTFIPDHPGGAQIITKCGQVVDDFSSMHPGGVFSGPKVQSILSSFILGKLKG